MTQLTFLGAAQTLTGSKYLLEHGGARVLFDCGLFVERHGDGRTRLLHHLAAALPNPRNTVLFVGFQAEGTQRGQRRNQTMTRHPRWPRCVPRTLSR